MAIIRADIEIKAKWLNKHRWSHGKSRASFYYYTMFNRFVEHDRLVLANVFEFWKSKTTKEKQRIRLQVLCWLRRILPQELVEMIAIMAFKTNKLFKP